jgi:hypothetical protein
MPMIAKLPLTEAEMHTLTLILQDPEMSKRPARQQRNIRAILTKLRHAEPVEQ